MKETLFLLETNEQEIAIQHAIDSCVDEIAMSIRGSIHEQLDNAFNAARMSC